MQPSSFTAGPVNQVLWETKQVWQNILYIHYYILVPGMHLQVIVRMIPATVC